MRRQFSRRDFVKSSLLASAAIPLTLPAQPGPGLARRGPAALDALSPRGPGPGLGAKRALRTRPPTKSRPIHSAPLRSLDRLRDNTVPLNHLRIRSIAPCPSRAVVTTPSTCPSTTTSSNVPTGSINLRTLGLRPIPPRGSHAASGQTARCRPAIVFRAHRENKLQPP